MEKIHYSLFEYRDAKKIIEGAEIVRRYSDPCICNTTYKTKDGEFWLESESRLEYPENRYSLDWTPTLKTE